MPGAVVVETFFGQTDGPDVAVTVHDQKGLAVLEDETPAVDL
jgi:hypothetical protein